MRERGKEQGGAPWRILLDLDSTDDPTHGEQEGSCYHGYYGQHMYHPLLLVFDGETDQLVTTVLRAGNSHAGRGAVAVLKRIVGRLKQEEWPDVKIEILRADAGFAVPAVYEWCEREGVGYTIGLVPNPRLEAIAKPLLERAQRESDERGGEKVRLVADAPYEAGSWGRRRRSIVYKAEAMHKGTNTRSLWSPAAEARLPRGSTTIGTCRTRRDRGVDKGLQASTEVRPVELQALFWANQFRLLLHAAAYWLLDTLRRKLVVAGTRRMQLDTLRLRLIKIGGRVRQLLTVVRMHLASSHPGQRLWRLLDESHRRTRE